MSSVPCMDQLMKGLNNLPDEIAQNMKLLRSLDSMTQQLMCEIDKMADNYMATHKESSAKKNEKTMKTINRMYKQVKEYGDDKVQLAIQTYELVDKHIRKFDSSLIQFENQMKRRTINNDIFKRHLKSKYGNKSSETDIFNSLNNSVNSLTGVGVKTDGSASVHSEKSIKIWTDMPVDPNEPLYCSCKQVSFGEMIMCDGKNCLVEWFHFECVKLKTKPKGAWFCSECSRKKSK